MTSANSAQTDDRFLSNAMASFIQIGALLILIMWCYSIIAPFVIILAWGMIISVALYPAHTSLAAKLGGREKSSAFILVAIGLAIVIVPTWLTAGSSISALHEVHDQLEQGSLTIQPPSQMTVSIANE